jgi:ABC-2 type transport system ATP-binding protein
MTTVRVHALSQDYGARRALDNVSFMLTPGVTALVGVNGAGKSSLLRILSGAQRPTHGVVEVMGSDPYQWRSRRTALTAVAHMPQGSDFPTNLTAHEVVASIGWLMGLSSRSARSRAREVLELVGLQDEAATRVGKLSGGMARRVALAQALVTDPAILLLDEPSTGLDPEQRRAMIMLVKQVGASTVLFSSHVMEDVEDVADRVLVLEEGKLVLDDSLEGLCRRGVTAAGQTSSSSSAESGFLETLRSVRSVRRLS